MHFIVYREIALRRVPPQLTARTCGECTEAVLNGHAPNVSVRCWKDAVIWDNKSSKRYSLVADRSPQQTRNRICAIWFVISSFCVRPAKPNDADLRLMLAAGVSPTESSVL